MRWPTRTSCGRSPAWGPTVRVAPVAQAWRELAMAMQRAGCRRVDEPAEIVLELAQKLWLTLPSAPMMS
jgi:hypothetical protein